MRKSCNCDVRDLPGSDSMVVQFPDMAGSVYVKLGLRCILALPAMSIGYVGNVLDHEMLFVEDGCVMMRMMIEGSFVWLLLTRCRPAAARPRRNISSVTMLLIHTLSL